jgi:hypothetical protein
LASISISSCKGQHMLSSLLYNTRELRKGSTDIRTDQFLYQDWHGRPGTLE